MGERNDDLERISDAIRSGEPVGIFEAIAAIHYQEALRIEREKARRNVWWCRLIRNLTGRNEHRGDSRGGEVDRG